MVPDGRFFAPDRLPGLVQRVESRRRQDESAVQVVPVQQVEAQAGRQDDRLSGAVQRIFGNAVHDGELQLQLPVRAAEDDGVGRHFRGLGPTGGGQEGDRGKKKESFHIHWL